MRLGIHTAFTRLFTRHPDRVIVESCDRGAIGKLSIFTSEWPESTQNIDWQILGTKLEPPTTDSLAGGVDLKITKDM